MSSKTARTRQPQIVPLTRLDRELNVVRSYRIKGSRERLQIMRIDHDADNPADHHFHLCVGYVPTPMEAPTQMALENYVVKELWPGRIAGTVGGRGG